MGYGSDYKYPHNYPGGFVPQDYLGTKLEKAYYRPKSDGKEKIIKDYLQKLQVLLKDNSTGNEPTEG